MKRIFYDLFGLNTELFLIINKITNYGYIPYLLKYLSSLFLFPLFVPYFIIICIYCLYQIKASQPEQKEREFHKYCLRLVSPGLCYSLFILTYASLKYYLNMPRPYCSLDQELFISIINFDGERCLSSFPSAHSALALIISFYLWPYLNKFAKLIAIVIIILVGLARVSLAMHYPMDVVYGILIGFITIFITKKIYNISKESIIVPLINLVFKHLKKFI